MIQLMMVSTNASPESSPYEVANSNVYAAEMRKSIASTSPANRAQYWSARSPRPMITNTTTLNTAKPMNHTWAAENIASNRSDRKSTRLNSSHVAISYAV